MIGGKSARVYFLQVLTEDNSRISEKFMHLDQVDLNLELYTCIHLKFLNVSSVRIGFHYVRSIFLI